MKKLIVYLFLVIIVFNISAIYHGLIDPDEPRYSVTAKNMTVTGDYIVPYFNDKLRINKPPLTYWLIAGSYKLFKINEYFSRLPHIICSILIILFGIIILKEFLSINERTTFVMVLSTIPLFFYLGRYCNTDIIMSTFFIFSVYFFYLYYKKDNLLFLYLFYLSYFFTNLAKGPVAYIILIIIFLFLLYEKQLKKLLNIKFWIIIVILSLTPFIYLILISLKTENSLNIFSLITTETIGRFVKGYRHPEPIYFYFKFFPLIFFPWSILFIFRINKIKNLWKESSFNRLNVIFFFVILIFFSLSKSKLLSYILPATFPFALILAKILEDFNLKFKSDYFIYIYGLIFIGLTIFLISTHYKLPDFNNLLIFLGILSISLICLKIESSFVNKFALFQLLLLTTIFILGANFLSENKSEKFLSKITPDKNIKVISYRRNITGIAFYFSNYKEVDNLESLPKKKEFYLVSYKSDFSRIKNKLNNCKKLAESKIKIMVKCNAINNK